MESAAKGKAKRRHLSADECGELGRSPEGTHILTQPLSLTPQKDPNRGLYPRTPTKSPRTPSKRKKLDGDQDRRQRSIGQFFPVTGVVRVSPQKTAQPRSSTQTDRTGEGLTPKMEERLGTAVEDGRLEALATPIKEEPEEKMNGVGPQKTAQPCSSSSSSEHTDRPGALRSPVKEECLRTPVKEECLRTPVKEECLRTPVKEEYLRTPVKEECLRTPVKEEYLRTPVKEECLRTPVKEEYLRTPVKEECLRTPVKEECLRTPVKEEPLEAFATPGVEDEPEDYLEGMTEAMFGDDEEFEAGASGGGEEDAAWEAWDGEEVDALPDAHYGLLGSSGGLVQPQGHVEDLPEEVLRLVFSLLPAGDLYRHVSLVCHRWRDVVKQPLFVPWKKLYYRYLRGEKAAVTEVQLLLRRKGVVKEDHLSVVNMIKYMAEYKPGQRVKPEAVLESVRKHRLFPQAEACLKQRIPEIEGIEGGPNPWAAMALILLLCDGVGDVLDLTSLLAACMPTQSAVTEYLGAMATVLLAMTNGKINISSRRYYNIFYVLHLMENIVPATMRTNQSGRVQVQPTHEQQQILNHHLQAEQVVKIVAFAGTGKTTTLVRYAQQRPFLRFLYVAFNKSVANQALRCFPSNVDCKTVHSMAFGAVGKTYQLKKKLGANLKAFSLAWVLPKGRAGFINAKVVTLTLNAFMASTDRRVVTAHVPNKFRNNRGMDEAIDHDAKVMFVMDAQNIWDKMVDQNERREGYHMTHDGYLKLWQLREPCLDKYDAIFIDEAQDCTPAIMDIMLNQRCGKILVGDPHQQIYTFRGAVNALRLVPHTHLYYLTQSFRFGAEIAYVGATILQVCKRVKKTLVGGSQDGSVRGENSDDVVSCVKNGMSPARGKTAILSRCNLTVFSEAVRLTDANPRCRLHIVGGVENFGLRRILDIWVLMQPDNNRQRAIRDSFIRTFTRQSLGGFLGLKAYAKKTEDLELEAKLAVVEKYNSRIPELVDRIFSCHENSYEQADFILGTVHKSKGLEFDTVVVTDDFAKVPVARHNLQRVNYSTGDTPEDEWNLLYVAVTRAKRTLIITKNITNILTLAGEYCLRSELTSALLKDGQPAVCSVRECRKHIMPESPITMSKLPIRYMDSFDAGGPLCEGCLWQRLGPSTCLLAPPEKLQSLPLVQERLDLPINYSLLLALF